MADSSPPRHPTEPDSVVSAAGSRSAEPSSAPASLLRPRNVALVALVLLALLLWLAHGHIRFDWRSLGPQLRSVSLPLLAAAVAFNYIAYWLRAWRWAVLIGPIHKASALELLPSQLIGFTIVGLFGRVADLGRPYLVARRLHTTVAAQLAVYSIERAFDLAAAAILFSGTLAVQSLRQGSQAAPHHEAFARAGALSLAATLFLVIFAVALRLAGSRIAALAERLLQPVSAKFATSAAERIREFSQGLHIVSTLHEFFAALALSLVMWTGVALMYLESARCFRACPQLAGLSFAGVMLLMATSMGSSLLQLPIVGWFTQIAVLAAALHGFFAVPLAAASACGVVLLTVANLVVIPAGLLAARREGITLRDAAQSPQSV